MHRDIKPLNIVINPETKDLRLIDWGLADYYHEGQEYNVRVASRYYKGPELLVDDKKYHYSLDMWSLGCTFASMIFKVDTFFKGADNYDQLVKIAQVLGTDDLVEYIGKYSLTLPKQCAKILKKYPRKDLREFVNEENRETATPEALDLLERMLAYDKNTRITPPNALLHPYLAPVI